MKPSRFVDFSLVLVPSFFFFFKKKSWIYITWYVRDVCCRTRFWWNSVSFMDEYLLKMPDCILYDISSFPTRVHSRTCCVFRFAIHTFGLYILNACDGMMVWFCPRWFVVDLIFWKETRRKGHITFVVWSNEQEKKR